MTEEQLQELVGFGIKVLLKDESQLSGIVVDVSRENITLLLTNRLVVCIYFSEIDRIGYKVQKI